MNVPEEEGERKEVRTFDLGVISKNQKVGIRRPRAMPMMVSKARKERLSSKILNKLAVAEEEMVQLIQKTIVPLDAARPFPAGWLGNCGVRRVDKDMLRRIWTCSMQPPMWDAPGDYTSIYEGRYYCFVGTVVIRGRAYAEAFPAEKHDVLKKRGCYSCIRACHDLCMCVSNREQLGYALADSITDTQTAILDALKDRFLPPLPGQGETPFPKSKDDIYGILNNWVSRDSTCVDYHDFLVFVPVRLFDGHSKFIEEQDRLVGEEFKAGVQDPHARLPLPRVDKLVEYVTAPGKLKAFVLSTDIRAEPQPHKWKLLRDYVGKRYDTSDCVHVL